MASGNYRISSAHNYFLFNTWMVFIFHGFSKKWPTTAQKRQLAQQEIIIEEKL